MNQLPLSHMPHRLSLRIHVHGHWQGIHMHMQEPLVDKSHLSEERRSCHVDQGRPRTVLQFHPQVASSAAARQYGLHDLSSANLSHHVRSQRWQATMHVDNARMDAHEVLLENRGLGQVSVPITAAQGNDTIVELQHGSVIEAKSASPKHGLLRPDGSHLDSERGCCVPDADGSMVYINIPLVNCCHLVAHGSLGAVRSHVSWVCFAASE
mmetsp:Transcript_4252/g.12034  ORF Transcript_4252/g.12034 Transcript_4252/m.12034 type:complete len:210 (-) Transcript_4252:163-792(-)